MSIRLRLTLICTVIVVLVLAVGGVLFVTGLNAGAEQSLDTTLTARADQIISELGTGSSSLEGAHPRRYGLGSANGIFSQLLTTNGTVVASPRPLASRPLATPQQSRSAAHTPLFFDRDVNLHAPAEPGSEALRVLVTPTHRAGVVLAVAVSRDVADKTVQRATNQLFVLGGIVLILTAPGAWWLTRAALRPVERMRAQVAALRPADADTGLAVPRTRDEIARLGQTFNDLVGRLHAALARERAFVADAGHELRTPLTVLKSELELARRPGRSRDELAEAVEIAADETDRLVRLTERLLTLSRDADTEPVAAQPFDLDSVTDAAVAAATPRAVDRQLRIVRSAAAPLRATGDADRIRQAIDNLLDNAIRYAPPNTTIDVAVHSDDGMTRLSVRDHGAGFEPQFIPHAFDRFTRADHSRGDSQPSESGNSGLGLAIVRSIMTLHGGTASAANHPDGGAVLTLRWPRVDQHDDEN